MTASLLEWLVNREQQQRFNSALVSSSIVQDDVRQQFRFHGNYSVVVDQSQSPELAELDSRRRCALLDRHHRDSRG